MNLLDSLTFQRFLQEKNMEELRVLTFYRLNHPDENVVHITTVYHHCRSHRNHAAHLPIFRHHRIGAFYAKEKQIEQWLKTFEHFNARFK